MAIPTVCHSTGLSDHLLLRDSTENGSPLLVDIVHTEQQVTKWGVLGRGQPPGKVTLKQT